MKILLLFANGLRVWCEATAIAFALPAGVGGDLPFADDWILLDVWLLQQLLALVDQPFQVDGVSLIWLWALPGDLSERWRSTLIGDRRWKLNSWIILKFAFAVRNFQSAGLLFWRRGNIKRMTRFPFNIWMHMFLMVGGWRTAARKEWWKLLTKQCQAV